MNGDFAEGLLESLDWSHERVQLVHDEASGLRAVIAVHSTVLGPALGGLRIRGYRGGLAEALDDALRLSRAMTLKASAAGLELGGGKAVIVDDGREELRRPRLAALAAELERLDGAYITAEDIGTTTADMDFISEHTTHVVGRSARGGCGGDPSPDTARTVLGATKAALGLLGEGSVDGLTVGVVGLGKVGGLLAEWLLADGARVVGFDPVPAVRERMAGLGVELVDDVEALLARRLDVLAPCAVGGLVDEKVAAAVDCRVVCGAANNPLGGTRSEAILAERGILYVPDFIANCGGLIHADSERRGDGDSERLAGALRAATERAEAVLVEALESERLPGVVAEEHALARIERARSVTA
ncbi:MAG TPA: Glu/Leu/Phe/Val dehydrogenase dimerization domain-containing protein [Solirubrobacterales bacterium]|nr:Glu/Leu/Phe/Val dehydrogenase dimerization domain-containing protein [Solirubrobacterales bacterium]